MLQKLRTDITKKLKTSSLLLLNVEVFSKKADSFDYGKIWSNSHDGLLDKLKQVHIDVLGLSNNSSYGYKVAEDMGISIKKFNGSIRLEEIFDSKSKYEPKEIVYMGCELGDIDTVSDVLFGVSTNSAPLDLKMVSDYVSNFDGIDAFEEIGNLILNAKTKPYGYSE